MTDLIEHKLPEDVTRLIQSFLIPGAIVFKPYPEINGPHINYNMKYGVAYSVRDNFGDTMIEARLTDSTIMCLSRIAKKNGRHRYYLTRCDRKPYGDTRQERLENMYYDDYLNTYSSTYIGKSLCKAIVLLTHL